MRSRGLIRGGSLDNALVCDAKAGWLNESGVRFENEPARHKLLDLIGDLALLPGHASLRVYKPAFIWWRPEGLAYEYTLAALGERVGSLKL